MSQSEIHTALQCITATQPSILTCIDPCHDNWLTYINVLIFPNVVFFQDEFLATVEPISWRTADEMFAPCDEKKHACEIWAIHSCRGDAEQNIRLVRKLDNVKQTR